MAKAEAAKQTPTRLPRVPHPLRSKGWGIVCGSKRPSSCPSIEAGPILISEGKGLFADSLKIAVKPPHLWKTRQLLPSKAHRLRSFIDASYVRFDILNLRIEERPGASRAFAFNQPSPY